MQGCIAFCQAFSEAPIQKFAEARAGAVGLYRASLMGKPCQLGRDGAPVQLVKGSAMQRREIALQVPFDFGKA